MSITKLFHSQPQTNEKSCPSCPQAVLLTRITVQQQQLDKEMIYILFGQNK